MLGVIGTKLGMTRVFKDNGTSVPVTVIEVAKSKIVQRKTPEKDGYYAVQVNFGSKKKGLQSLFPHIKIKMLVTNTRREHIKDYSILLIPLSKLLMLSCV